MRTVNRLLALLLGLGSAAAAVLVAVEAVRLHGGERRVLVPRTSWDRDLAALRWDDPGLRTVAVVLVVVGSVLLVAQLVPRRPVRYALRSGPDRPSWIARGSLDQVLADAVRRDPDVLDVTVGSRGRRASVAVTAPRSVDRVQLRERVAATVADQLSAIDVERPLAVAVRARHAKDRVR